MALNFPRKSSVPETTNYDQGSYRSEGHTFGSSIHIVWPIIIALDVSRETNTGLELALKDVALVKKEYEVDLG